MKRYTLNVLVLGLLAIVGLCSITVMQAQQKAQEKTAAMKIPRLMDEELDLDSEPRKSVKDFTDLVQGSPTLTGSWRLDQLNALTARMIWEAVNRVYELEFLRLKKETIAKKLPTPDDQISKTIDSELGIIKIVLYKDVLSKVTDILGRSFYSSTVKSAVIHALFNYGMKLPRWENDKGNEGKLDAAFAQMQDNYSKVLKAYNSLGGRKAYPREISVDSIKNYAQYLTKFKLDPKNRKQYEYLLDKKKTDEYLLGK